MDDIPLCSSFELIEEEHPTVDSHNENMQNNSIIENMQNNSIIENKKIIIKKKNLSQIDVNYQFNKKAILPVQNKSKKHKNSMHIDSKNNIACSNTVKNGSDRLSMSQVALNNSNGFRSYIIRKSVNSLRLHSYI